MYGLNKMPVTPCGWNEGIKEGGKWKGGGRDRGGGVGDTSCQVEVAGQDWAGPAGVLRGQGTKGKSSPAKAQHGAAQRTAVEFSTVHCVSKLLKEFFEGVPAQLWRSSCGEEGGAAGGGGLMGDGG